MNPAHDIAEFLTSRRARVAPEQVGLPAYGPRRVTGLRREEVVALAGIVIDHATLDRIDEIVRPGVNLNPADTSYGEQVLNPVLRRR